MSGGAASLPGAVTDFINDFTDNYDQAGMVSYATIATADVPLTNVFRTAISTAAGNLEYVGGTFSIGGLVLASNQLASASNLPGLQAIKVAVFFADDSPNIIEQRLNCPPQSPWIIGGYDNSTYVGFWQSNASNTVSQQNDPTCYLSNGGTPPCCGGQGYFLTETGIAEPFLRQNVTTEAEYEAVEVANLMRTQGIYVFAVGLSTSPIDPVNTNFLQEVANDPQSPVYNPYEPAGAALITTNPAELEQAFQSIAALIPAF